MYFLLFKSTVVGNLEASMTLKRSTLKLIPFKCR